MTVPITTEVNARTRSPEELQSLYQSDEILWFKNGRWGDAGYGIPNCSGKTWTDNDTIFEVHNALGRTLFDLLHRSAVKFPEPPHASFFWDMHLALTIGRKRLLDRRLTKGQELTLDPKHVSATPKTFLVYPVPHFGMRVRQRDIAEYGRLGMTLLSEMMQHSANEEQYWIGEQFVTMSVGYINEILTLVATKYFGYTREEFRTAGFSIAPDRFTEANYRPWEFVMPIERSTERQPQLWWPTENDLSAINGIPITDAMLFAARWPQNIEMAEGDWETTSPGAQATQAGQQTGDSSTGSARTEFTGRPV